MKNIFKSIVLLAGIAAVANAGTIVLTIPGSGGRTASLTDAVSGVHANSINYGASDIGSAFGGTWVSEGEIAPSSGSPGGIYMNDLLTVNLTSGSWGSSNVAGTWAIHPSFWLTWGKAVISMHVGQGNGDPDAFAWLITPGQTSGTWSYYDHDGKGGGLSNLKLWGSDRPTRVPDYGATILLISLGLSAFLIAGRRSKSA